MDPTALKTVFSIPVGIDKYAYLLRLESVVRQRLNKLLSGGKAHLGWEYGATSTVIRVFTSSKRYTTDTEATLSHAIRHFLGVRADVMSSTAEVVPKIRGVERSVSSASEPSRSSLSSSVSDSASDSHSASIPRSAKPRDRRSDALPYPVHVPLPAVA